ncbi:sulfurtransferase [Aliiglaciecola sp. 3_MG-2023]|uniref:sulfurtransferase n=1 Tax=Aliiglaciecola sp. 3_MG-2023 TaxID=3062644 RepID=UPI0026E1DF99|nr:sulfurtransferase [Aliiglaciecola sp. 3_MG-2023]MDO6692594.1 sulfurtransferase [Aliiglaciecola sp. 3_MG-2023]
MNSNQIETNRALIQPAQLQDLLQRERVNILFTDVDFPVNYISKQSEKCYLPNSILFDFDNVFVDKNSGLPHSLPSPEHFAKEMSNLGINNDSTLVIYDDQGSFSAPRVWWMLKVMGHDKVFVLDGGLQAWIDAGLDVADELVKKREKTQYKVTFNEQLLVDKNNILDNLSNQDCLVIDARSAARFNGTEAEPRKGVRSGHIPRSRNLHYAQLLNDGKFINSSAIKQLFEPMIDGTQTQLIFSCGSGVTACILALAAYQIGNENWAVYDGSWSEWGADPLCPIE